MLLCSHSALNTPILFHTRARNLPPYLEPSCNTLKLKNISSGLTDWLFSQAVTGACPTLASSCLKIHLMSIVPTTFPVQLVIFLIEEDLSWTYEHGRVLVVNFHYILNFLILATVLLFASPWVFCIHMVTIC